MCTDCIALLCLVCLTLAFDSLPVGLDCLEAPNTSLVGLVGSQTELNWIVTS